MPASNVPRLLLLPAGAVLALGLAGCSGTTYGTGISPEQQTLEDVMSLASLGSKETPPIDYRPRGGIVAPPTNALPPPGTKPNLVAAIENDPNWPKDPDEERRRRAAAKSSTSVIPNFILPQGQTSYSASEEVYDAQRKADGVTAWQTMRKERGGSYDTAGNPTRKYLTEPPLAYREPDPNAPMKEPAAKKPSMQGWDISKLWPF